MNELRWFWSDVLRWVEWVIDAVRSLPPNDLVALVGICALAALILVFAWLHVVRRNRALKRRVKALQVELDDVRTAYDNEVKWRQAADRVFGQEASSRPGPQRD
jgi:hypothetical protein